MTFILAMLMLINAERPTPLVLSANLDLRAQSRAEYLCSAPFSHQGFQLWFAGIKPSGYIGENLAKNFPDATSTNAAFMASAPHRANILSKDYHYIGIGHACGITVELFSQQKP